MKRVIKKAESMTIGAVIFMLIPLIITWIQASFYLLMPTSFWFEYESIKPIKSINESHEQIPFMTHYIIKRPFNFQSTHILYCNNKEDTAFKFFSSQVNTVPKDIIKESYTKKWEIGEFLFLSEKPFPPRECRLISTVTNLDIPSKTQTIIGDIFKIQ